MVTDAATAHRATTLRVPERITLVRLPPSTPELNPTERLWTMVREGVANRDFSTLDGLEQSVCTRCQKDVPTKLEMKRQSISAKVNV